MSAEVPVDGIAATLPDGGDEIAATLPEGDVEIAATAEVEVEDNDDDDNDRATSTDLCDSGLELEEDLGDEGPDPETDLALHALDSVDIGMGRTLRAEVCVPAPTTGFILSLTDHGRMRRLHHLGACWRKPGEHYAHWLHFGAILPGPELYDARCRTCFPAEAARAPVARLPEDVRSEDESDTSSESSSSAPTGAAVKKRRGAE